VLLIKKATSVAFFIVSVGLMLLPNHVGALNGTAVAD